jgi:hypothetical protein
MVGSASTAFFFNPPLTHEGLLLPAPARRGQRQAHRATSARPTTLIRAQRREARITTVSESMETAPCSPGWDWCWVLEQEEGEAVKVLLDRSRGRMLASLWTKQTSACACFIDTHTQGRGGQVDGASYSGLHSTHTEPSNRPRPGVQLLTLHSSSHNINYMDGEIKASISTT